MPVLICVAMNGGHCTLYDNLGDISKYSLNLYSSQSACERAGASAVKKVVEGRQQLQLLLPRRHIALAATAGSAQPDLSRLQPLTRRPARPSRSRRLDRRRMRQPPLSLLRPPRRGPVLPPRRTAPPADTASAQPAAGAPPPAAATPPSTTQAPAVVAPSPPGVAATTEIEAGPPPPSIAPAVEPEIAPPPPAWACRAPTAAAIDGVCAGRSAQPWK